MQASAFQIHEETLFLNDDSNTAVFPEEDGHFTSIHLNVGGHYEVNGETKSAAPASSPGTSQHQQNTTPHRFAFAQRVKDKVKLHLRWLQVLHQFFGDQYQSLFNGELIYIHICTKPMKLRVMNQLLNYQTI